MNRQTRREEEDDREEEEAIEPDTDAAKRGYRAVARVEKVSVAPTIVGNDGGAKNATSPWHTLSSIEIDDDGISLNGMQRWAMLPSHALVVWPLLLLSAGPLFLREFRHRLPWWWTWVNAALAWIGQLPLRVTTRVEWRALRRLVVDRSRGRARIVYAVRSRWPAWLRRRPEREVAVLLELDAHDLAILDARVSPHLAEWARLDAQIQDVAPTKKRWMTSGLAVATLIAAIVCGVGLAVIR